VRVGLEAGVLGRALDARAERRERGLESRYVERQL
jgi:hypothetical protein